MCLCSNYTLQIQTMYVTKMKVIIFILSIFLCVPAISQSGYSWIAIGSKLDEYTKIVKDSICNTCVGDGNGNDIPTLYHWCYYNYGEIPPEHIELTKSFLAGKRIDTIRGWRVEFIKRLEMSGDSYFSSWDVKETCLNKINSLLPLYYETFSISDGYGGFNISIDVSKEEANRRSVIIQQKYR